MKKIILFLSFGIFSASVAAPTVSDLQTELQNLSKTLDILNNSPALKAYVKNGPNKEQIISFFNNFIDNDQYKLYRPYKDWSEIIAFSKEYKVPEDIQDKLNKKIAKIKTYFEEEKKLKEKLKKEPLGLLTEETRAYIGQTFNTAKHNLYSPSIYKEEEITDITNFNNEFSNKEDLLDNALELLEEARKIDEKRPILSITIGDLKSLADPFEKAVYKFQNKLINEFQLKPNSRKKNSVTGDTVILMNKLLPKDSREKFQEIEKLKKKIEKQEKKLKKEIEKAEKKRSKKKK